MDRFKATPKNSIFYWQMAIRASRTASITTGNTRLDARN
jgi:hypothetical protein